MRSTFALIGAAGLAAVVLATATAPLAHNLNYASPSRRHAHLGIDVAKVTRRSASVKRDGIAPAQDSAPFPHVSFTHGVASGDPLPDSVILWTRAAPSRESDRSNVTVSGTVPLYSHETDRYVRASHHPVCVDWRVLAAPDRAADVVVSGTACTTSDIDYTLKVEATRLRPWTTYWYDFRVCGTNTTSPLGRTRTAPAADASVDEIRLAVFSCANYPNGYFNVYGNAARKDQHDYVVHLGDYIYEHDQGGERAMQPPRYTFSLWDYRTRHGQYRTDPDLQLLAQNSAWITTWDDHEVSNNGYRDGSSGLNNTEESFLNDGPSISVDQRKMNAVRAYFEWMPIRQVDMDDNLRIWRSFALGNLMDLIILDTRNYDRSITSLDWNDAYIDRIRDDASRTMMGSRQENWFYDQLTASADRRAMWRIVGDQVIFSHIAYRGVMSGDNWNGYTANRNRTLQHLYDNSIGNNIFLAGDSHENWVSDIAWLDERPYDATTGQGAIGVEFAGTAVSSSRRPGGIETLRAVSRDLVEENVVLQWHEGYYRGYFVLSVRPEKVTAQFYGSPSVATRNAWDLPLANFSVAAGENRVSRPLAGGSVEAGFLRGGTTVPTNLTRNTDTGAWGTVGFETMYISS